MGIFKSWLVSNIGGVFVFVYFIISLVFMNRGFEIFRQSDSFDPTMAVAEAKLLSAFCLFFISAVVAVIIYSVADGGFFGSLLVGLFGIIVIALGLFLVWGGLTGWEGLQKTIAGYGAYISIYFISAFVVSVLVAIYAYANFDDIVDRRWLYRHSDVSIYEEEWKYALNRFAVVMSGFSGLAVLLGILIFGLPA